MEDDVHFAYSHLCYSTIKLLQESHSLYTDEQWDQMMAILSKVFLEDCCAVDTDLSRQEVIQKDFETNRRATIERLFTDLWRPERNQKKRFAGDDLITPVRFLELYKRAC